MRDWRKWLLKTARGLAAGQGWPLVGAAGVGVATLTVAMFGVMMREPPRTMEASPWLPPVSSYRPAAPRKAPEPPAAAPAAASASPAPA
ncbi:MAG: hypothetical protein PHF00_12600, partial [Elusimicrobia bacterium]|nr:hypothetical protein [Elusimicrobiota bacterium]